jgi:hypothetical protein
MAVLITGYKNVLLFKETVSHLYWLCELKRYPCYFCRSSFDIRAGCLQWQGTDCVRRTAAQRIVHPAYNDQTLINDIALLRVGTAFPTNSKYPSPVSPYVAVYSAATCDCCSTLWLLHILAVDTHNTHSVTHNHKVNIT